MKLQLNAIRSPCNECDHHKMGLTKCCRKCRKCKKRIAYNDFVDGIMDGTNVSMFEQGQSLIINTDRYKKKEGLLPLQEKSLRHLGRPDKVDRDEVKREYIKKAVPKKMKLKELAKIFGITVRHLRRKRKAENWPERKNPECNEEGCHGIVVAKNKCSRCYHRILYQKKVLGKKRKGN